MYRSSKYELIRYQTDLLKTLPIPIRYTDTVKCLPYTAIVQHIHKYYTYATCYVVSCDCKPFQPCFNKKLIPQVQIFTSNWLLIHICTGYMYRLIHV